MTFLDAALMRCIDSLLEIRVYSVRISTAQMNSRTLLALSALRRLPNARRCSPAMSSANVVTLLGSNE